MFATLTTLATAWSLWMIPTAFGMAAALGSNSLRPAVATDGCCCEECPAGGCCCPCEACPSGSVCCGETCPPGAACLASCEECPESCCEKCPGCAACCGGEATVKRQATGGESATDKKSALGCCETGVASRGGANASAPTGQPGGCCGASGSCATK